MGGGGCLLVSVFVCVILVNLTSTRDLINCVLTLYVLSLDIFLCILVGPASDVFDHF